MSPVLTSEQIVKDNGITQLIKETYSDGEVFLCEWLLETPGLKEFIDKAFAGLN